MGQVLSSVVNWLFGAGIKRNSSTPKLSEPLNSAPEKEIHVINIDDINDSIPLSEDEPAYAHEEVDGFLTGSDFVAISLNGSSELNPNEEHILELKKRDLLIKPERWIKHYCSSHNILLVGEGDFSFSLCLANAFGRADNMIATSLNPKGFLRANYKNAMSNIAELESMGCKVKHKVDATKMASYADLHIVKFDRIVYNFPLAGFFRNESTENQLKKNKELVSLFLKNAKQMISETGEIHITHKSNGFFSQWDLKGLAKQNGLRLVKVVKFNLKDYPGYCTKYGFGGDKNFDCHPSKTYKFQL